MRRACSGELVRARTFSRTTSEANRSRLAVVASAGGSLRATSFDCRRTCGDRCFDRRARVRSRVSSYIGSTFVFALLVAFIYNGTRRSWKRFVALGSGRSFPEVQRTETEQHREGLHVYVTAGVWCLRESCGCTTPEGKYLCPCRRLSSRLDSRNRGGGPRLLPRYRSSLRSKRRDLLAHVSQVAAMIH